MQKITLPPLAVTSGDPAGIGFEITISAWQQRHSHDIPPFVLFADAGQLARRAAEVGIPINVIKVDHVREARGAFVEGLPVIDTAQSEPSVVGKPDPRNGAAVIGSIERAAHAVISGEAAALVTNPIAKSVLYAHGFKYPGHTEFLAALAQSAFPERSHTPVMMLACEELRVVPLTIHVPLSAVAGLITQALIVETARITDAALKRDFGLMKPRIAIAGLNPHAGEMGTIGREEETEIRPAIQVLQHEGINATGPHAADTLFHAAARARYDAVIAMYHDQALIPIKTLAFDRGVNMTLGLPFVRTSPDHGTAFDIAGQGIANADSFIAALKLARDAAVRRTTAPV